MSVPHSSIYHLQSISTFFQGKSLLAHECPVSEENLKLMVEQNKMTTETGIIKKEDSLLCNRCGNTTPHLFSIFPCYTCNQLCTYCRHCIRMGRVTTCNYLYQWKEVLAVVQSATPQLVWEGALSQGQQIASQKVKEAIEQRKELLVWAVCGAGKTEVLFAGIETALKQQWKVCIATPRTDVVLELAPRLRKVFPTTTISALYGGTEDSYENHPLVITTTHQLYRFKTAFDVIIVDEVDAFPFSYDKSLQFAVKKAGRPDAARIYLTATPSRKMQKECAQQQRHFVTIPARFHRYSLPVPRLKWCGNWRKQCSKGKIPSVVSTYVKTLLSRQSRCLIFIPSIVLLEQILPIFQRLHPQIESVHSEDPNRKEKVTRMRKGEIPILLTTTILERGVTLPAINVAVLGAEEAVFNEAALVQIAGRVGRSKDYPTGDITFFHYGKTIEMIRAKQSIISMNDEARKKGLLEE